MRRAARSNGARFRFLRKKPEVYFSPRGKEDSRATPPVCNQSRSLRKRRGGLPAEARGTAGFDVYQFHGDETPEFCAAFGEDYIKAVRVKDASSLDAVWLYDTDVFLFDAYSPDAYGGTGENFSWDVLSGRKLGDKFVILSGGLTPENVRDAIRTVNPYAVDVSSGVESSPGTKDHLKLKRFMEVASYGQN